MIYRCNKNNFIQAAWSKTYHLNKSIISKANLKIRTNISIPSSAIELSFETSSGTKTTKNYIKGQLLRKVGEAECFEITDLKNQKLSEVKIIKKSTLTKDRIKQKLLTAIKIHRSLSHENIIKFEDISEDDANIYLFSEFCSNRSMYELLRRRKFLTELEVRCYLVQLMNGLKYLHSNKIIHRDLKLGNIFLSDKMQLKIGEFGNVTMIEYDGERKRSINGTQNYIAPEILDGKAGYSYEIDIWSVGLILYSLVLGFGKNPFESADIKTAYKKIKTNSILFPEDISVSHDAKNLITRCLNCDPSKRPSIDEILEDSFIKNGENIPKILPAETWDCPLNECYQKSF